MILIIPKLASENMICLLPHMVSEGQNLNMNLARWFQCGDSQTLVGEPVASEAKKHCNWALCDIAVNSPRACKPRESKAEATRLYRLIHYSHSIPTAWLHRPLYEKEGTWVTGGGCPGSHLGRHLTTIGKKPALHLSKEREFQAQEARRKKLLRQKHACHFLPKSSKRDGMAEEDRVGRGGGQEENKVRWNRDGLAQYGR